MSGAREGGRYAAVAATAPLKITPVPRTTENELGRRYGRWLVVEYLRSGNWLCRCVACDTTKTLHGKRLRRDESLGCPQCDGCRRGSPPTHGGSKTRLYTIWVGMRVRCGDPRSKDWKLYGLRGLRVCATWLNDFAAFRRWSLANGYRDDLTIDRIDNDRGYKPSNCRWVDRATQSANRRPISQRASVAP